MAIGEDGVDGVSAVGVGDLLVQPLRIPSYQRPYSWEPATALQLVDDIEDAFRGREGSAAPYVLGTVILHAHDQVYDIVDGQQRLLTLWMLLARLDGDDVIGTTRCGDSPVVSVWQAFGLWIAALRPDELAARGSFIRERCQLVRVVTNQLDEAFRVFDSQNYRGKPLAPHDLLKAYHLREMRGETAIMKSAVVEGWESVPDEDLDRIFSLYLYRIARWSRGESAPGFTVHDIVMFKGITAQNSQSPTARYHLAAQSAVPMLAEWSGVAAKDAWKIRFQLDAPVAAGRPFFEMVEFMLEELKRVRKAAFPSGWADFASSDPDSLKEKPGKKRYRYVGELYLAALFYYVNKFSHEDITVARDRIFAWAYTLRVTLERVQVMSVDRRGRGGLLTAGGGRESAAFLLIRNTLSGRVVYQLPASSTPHHDGHEPALAALLKELGA